MVDNDKVISLTAECDFCHPDSELRPRAQLYLSEMIQKPSGCHEHGGMRGHDHVAKTTEKLK